MATDGRLPVDLLHVSGAADRCSLPANPSRQREAIARLVRHRFPTLKAIRNHPDRERTGNRGNSQ
jgi:hypothetical protein